MSFHYSDDFSTNPKVKIGLSIMIEKMYFDRIEKTKIDEQMDRFK